MLDNYDNLGVIPLEIPVQTTKHNKGNPCIELRRSIENINVMKTVIYCAFHDIPITFVPVFRDRLKSLNSLIEKGLIYRDKESGQYYFNF